MSKPWESLQRSWRGQGLLIVAVAAAVGLAGWLSGWSPDTGGEGSLRVEHGEHDDTPPPAPDELDVPAWEDLEEVGGEWAQLDDAPIPIPAEHVGVWTGEELVVGFQPEVAAYAPATGRWRRLPDVPGPARTGPRVVWTGQQVVVFGGLPPDDESAVRADGALLDLGSGQWQPLPEAPAAPLWDPTVVWTGEEVVVWGGARPGDAHERGEWPVRGSAYDPQLGRWRVLAQAPVEGVFYSEGLWTGREVVVWGSHHPPGQRLDDQAGPSFAAAYDPASDRWQRRAAPPLADAGEAAGVWTGSDVVVWGQAPPRSPDDPQLQVVGAALDLGAAEQGWRLLPPLDAASPSTSVYGVATAWTDVGAVFYGGYPRSVGLVYDAEERSWVRLPSHRARVGAVAAWTGRELLLWGGYTTSGPDVDLWAMRPRAARRSPTCQESAAAPPDTPPEGWSWAPSPLSGADPSVAVWTGTDLLVVTGRQGASIDLAGQRQRCLPTAPLDLGTSAVATWTSHGMFVWDDQEGAAALYDPAAATWRVLPRISLRAHEPVAVVWTGEEVIVWGDTQDEQAAADGAAYDPAADSWRALPDAPGRLNRADAAWTGGELIVYGARLDPNNAADTQHATGIAYSPGADRWRRLPDHPLSPQASTISWAANRLIAWDYLLNAAAYDPTTDGWTPLPGPPFPQLECSPDSVSLGARVVASYCAHAAVFDPSTQKWTALDVPPDITNSTHLVPLDDAVIYVLPSGIWRFQPR